MLGKPLDAFAELIKADPRCRGFAVARTVKTLYRAIADQGPIEVLALTHPNTSTEFFVGYTREDGYRLEMLRGGQAREIALEYQTQTETTWTDAYRAYYNDNLNRRAYLFHSHGTLEPDLEAPFYGVWVAEVASLHAPGHDDFGDTRSDGRVGLCRAMYATAVVSEATDWLARVIESLKATDTSLPPALKQEQVDIDRLAARLPVDGPADHSIVFKAEAHRIRDALDAGRLHAMFPRDHRGRLRARQRVLLEPAVKGSDRDRRPWVVATGPPRAGSNEIAIDVENLIAANHSERFDVAPWCWRRDSGDLEDPKTWGYTSDFDDPVALLLQGRIKEGLEASGLALDEAVSNLARGGEIGLLHPDPDWPKVTRDRLCRIAPWLLLGPGVEYARILLKRRADGLRLFTLPNQRAIRKASVVLVPGSAPSLEIRWTGTNARLPLVLWQRPAIRGVWGHIQTK